MHLPRKGGRDYGERTGEDGEEEEDDGEMEGVDVLVNKKISGKEKN